MTDRDDLLKGLRIGLLEVLYQKVGKLKAWTPPGTTAPAALTGEPGQRWRNGARTVALLETEQAPGQPCLWKVRELTDYGVDIKWVSDVALRSGWVRLP